MFDHTSRYEPIETATLSLPDGRVVAYKRRRFLPQRGDATPVAQVAVAQGDRLDAIAARSLGDPEQYWRICDVNGALDPTELTEEPGRVLDIALPSPQPGGSR
jgi:hypothetical protein